MTRIKKFFITSIIGGLSAVLPAAILGITFKWVFDKITTLIQPLTDSLLSFLHSPEIVAVFVVICIIFGICFLLGSFIRTGFGNFLHSNVEDHILNRIPFYSIVKDTLAQFLGEKKSPFSSVAVANIFGSNVETAVIVFVTDDCSSVDANMMTVFMPTGPNPTSGNIYIVPKDQVTLINVEVADVMRMIISCGSGTANLVQDYLKQKL